MAEVLVFVDDAVRGTLPPVCVKDGVPTGDSLVINRDFGGSTGLGIAWLLLLAGPLGWLGLLVIATLRSSRSDVLTVQVPLSEAAYERVLAARGLRRRGVGLGVLGGLVMILMLRGLGSPGTLAVFGVGAVVTLMAMGMLLIAEHRLGAERVGVELDASRRWVTLSRVHPEFARACRAAEQHQRA